MNEPGKITITYKNPQQFIVNDHKVDMKIYYANMHVLPLRVGGEKIVDIDVYNGIMIHYSEC